MRWQLLCSILSCLPAKETLPGAKLLQLPKGRCLRFWLLWEDLLQDIHEACHDFLQRKPVHQSWMERCSRRTKEKADNVQG